MDPVSLGTLFLGLLSMSHCPSACSCCAFSLGPLFLGHLDLLSLDPNRWNAFAEPHVLGFLVSVPLALGYTCLYLVPFSLDHTPGSMGLLLRSPHLWDSGPWAAAHLVLLGADLLLLHGSDADGAHELAHEVLVDVHRAPYLLKHAKVKRTGQAQVILATIIHHCGGSGTNPVGESPTKRNFSFFVVQSDIRCKDHEFLLVRAQRLASQESARCLGPKHCVSRWQKRRARKMRVTFLREKNL